MISKKKFQGITLLWISYWLLIIAMKLSDEFSGKENIDFFWISMTLCAIILFQWWAYSTSLKITYQQGIIEGTIKQRKRTENKMIRRRGIDKNSNNKCKHCGKRNHSKNTHCFDCGWEIR